VRQAVGARHVTADRECPVSEPIGDLRQLVLIARLKGDFGTLSV